MLPAFLITFREVIEATLIVATILGILVKLKHFKSIRMVGLATLSAVITSFALLVFGSFAGFKVQELYSGKIEEITEGILMMTSGIFITWAVFWLHTYFAKHKVQLLQKVKQTIEENERSGLFILVFTAVFREGFEIVLFLSSIFLSTNPVDVLGGFGAGFIMALLVSFGLFNATLKLPVFYAFRATSILLILFGAGLFGRGVHEFTEAGLLPELTKITLNFLPQSQTFVGSTIKALFGISHSMDTLQIVSYMIYIVGVSYFVFFRKEITHSTVLE